MPWNLANARHVSPPSVDRHDRPLPSAYSHPGLTASNTGASGPLRGAVKCAPASVLRASPPIACTNTVAECSGSTATASKFADLRISVQCAPASAVV